MFERTPLILAAIVGAEDCVDHLIENGAKIGIKDGRDMAAKDWALRKSFQRYSNMFLSSIDILSAVSCGYYVHYH